MLLLTTTSTLLQVVTTSTAQTYVHASYVDRSTTDQGGTIDSSIVSAGTFTIVAAPASSTTRNVRFLSLENADTIAQTITVQYFNGTNTIQLYSATLQPGWSAVLEEGEDRAWRLLNAAGMPVRSAVAGVLQRISLITGTSGYFTGPNTNQICIRGVGGGAAGGGCTSVASGSSAAGGGGAGGYVEATLAVSPCTAYPFACGAGGGGVSGAAGTNGGDSTFTVGATVVTAKGGTGGPVATGSTSLTSYPGGAGGTVSTNGSLNTGGQPGFCGIVSISSSKGASGRGGSTPFGAGGGPIIAAGTGNNATGLGAGGGGALTLTAAARAGGNGLGGCWIVEEYS